MVRAKFKCVEKTEREGGKLVKLHVVIGDNPENKEFFKWTPSGELNMGILNPDAESKFEVGKEYYVDFSPAE